MRPFTSEAGPEQSNHHQKPSGKSAHRNGGTESYRGDDSEAQRALREAVERQEGGLDGLQAARWQLLKLFARIERLGEHIDQAFAGQPFLPDMAPDAPANRRRFKTYVEQHRQTTKLLLHAVELWMLTCGMKREDDWVPVIIEDMRLRAQRRNG